MILRDYFPDRYQQYYDCLVRFRHSDVVEALFEYPLLPMRHFHLREAEPFFAVDICGVMGMGAILYHVVRLLKRAEIFDLIPVIGSTNPLYASEAGKDWFPDYFLSNRIPQHAVPRPLYHLPVRNEFSYSGLSVPIKIDLDDASRLFHTSFRFAEPVLALVERLHSAAGLKHFDIAVHYKAMDDRSDATSTPRSCFIDRCRPIVSELPAGAPLFLSTDEFEFEIAFRAAFPDHRVFTFNLGRTASDRRQGLRVDGRDRALGALVNMAVISSARLCVRTRSQLSAWSKVLNPELRTVTIDHLRRQKYDFPETGISDLETAPA